MSHPMPDRSRVRAGSGRRPCASEQGFTLIEIMVAVGIGVFVVGTAVSVLYSSQQVQSINEQTVETQQNARMAMELISEDFKSAGFTVKSITPPGIGNCGVNGVVPADNTPTGNDTGPDAVSMIVPVNLSTLATTITGAAPTANVALQAGAVAAAAADAFGTGGTIYALPGPVISIAGFYTGTVNTISSDTLTLTNSVQLPKEAQMPGNTTGTGMQVYWLKCVTYEVINSNSNSVTKQPLCGGTLPCLVRGTPPCVVGATNPCIPVVEGIEDLQIAYACDGCVGTEDGVIDDQAGGTAGQFDAADFVSNSSWNTGSFLPSTIRMAQVSIVARQMRTRLGSESVSGAKATISVALQVSDHNHTQDAGYSAAVYSKQQRRLLTRTIELTNMGY
ncbi:MAG: PilW family protein [Nitrospiraceae bacterium]